MKKYLMILLAFVMCLSLLPVTALAAESSATAQGVTITIDKSNYEHGEKIYYGWSGVTDAHASGVLWGMIAMAATGSEYDDWIDSEHVDCESAELDLDGLNHFTAPTTDGAYEMRFYWQEKDVGWEANYVLSVPFTVGNIKTGSISVAKTEHTANTSITVDYSGITAEMESADAFVGVFKPDAGHDVHEAADDDYKHVKAGFGQISLHTPNINGQFELRLYNTLYNLTADNLMMSIPITLSGATESGDAVTDSTHGDNQPVNDTKSDKCSICGFCPEPLGLCLFIWLAIILTIVVIIVVIIIATKKKKCPQCGTKVSKSADHCPKCGTEINKK